MALVFKRASDGALIDQHGGNIASLYIVNGVPTNAGLTAPLVVETSASTLDLVRGVVAGVNIRSSLDHTGAFTGNQYRSLSTTLSITGGSRLSTVYNERSAIVYSGTGGGNTLIGWGGSISVTGALGTALGSAINVNVAMAAGGSAAGVITTVQGMAVAGSASTTKTFTDHICVDLWPGVQPTATRNIGLRINGITSGGASAFNAAIHILTTSSGTGTQAGIVIGPSDSTAASFWRGATNQLLTQGDWMARRYRCSSVPSIAAGAGAGTSPSIAISGSDAGFTVTLTEGNPSATGVIFTATLGSPSSGAPPRVGISPGNAATAALSGTSVPFVTKSNTTVVLNSGSVALTAGTVYVWDFVCGYQ